MHTRRLLPLQGIATTWLEVDQGIARILFVALFTEHSRRLAADKQ